MKRLFYSLVAQGSFKRQIILTFVFGFFFLTIAFTAYQFSSERDYLYQESTDETSSLAEALAASSRSGLLANDVAGLLEVVRSFQDHPGLRYAMVISPSGQVLAHTDATQVGQFVSDPSSLALIKSPPSDRIMIDDESMSDVAVPITVGNRHVGWARVAQGREGIADGLHNMMLGSALFVLMALAFSLFAALVIASRLGSRIGSLVGVAEEVRTGNYATRANILGEDEIARLADSLNHMLDVLALEEQQLRAASRYTRNLIEASLDPLVTISPEGKITDVNKATEEITGRSRPELVGSDFSDYFTDPDKAREGYRRVFAKGSVTDYPLALRHRDGHVTDVLYNASVYRNEAGEVSGVFAAARDVTQRNMAEREVAQLNLQNRLILDSAGEGIYGLDVDGRCSFANPAASQLLGFEVGELVGRHSHHLFHHTKPDGSPYPQEECPVHAAYKQGTVLRGGDLYWRKDGSSFPVEFVSTPILDAGKIAGAVVAFSDITERKRAEAVLRESEEALKDAQRIAHLGSWHMDLATNQVVWSEVLYNMYGFDPTLPPPLYTESMKLFTPESWERLSSSIAKTTETGIPYQLELEMVPKDGGRGWMWARGELVRDGRGAPVRVRGVVMDITERKLAEEHLRRSEHGLAEAQRIAHLGNWELDQASNVLTWSGEIYRIFEIDPEKFGASYDAFLNGIHPEDREMVNSAYTESVKSKKPYDIVHRLLMKDGRVKYVNEKCETYYGADGKPLRSVGTVHDITAQKVAEIALTTLKDDLENRVRARTTELESANKELEAFSYSVSHDLRSPLRAIDGFSRILLDDYNDKMDDEGKRLLNVVRDNTSRMGQLIDDILKFSRTSRLEMTFSEINMGELARAVLDALQPDGHKLQVEISPIPSTWGDLAMMRQVFVNLLSNAIKFSRTKETPRIIVGGSIAGDEAVYFVRDNGAGFDMQYADKLFGVFQRLHGMNEFEGTGIGLAIVKRIITRHGGRVWAEGKVDGGATIYFALPVKPPARTL